MTDDFDFLDNFITYNALRIRKPGTEELYILGVTAYSSNISLRAHLRSKMLSTYFDFVGPEDDYKLLNAYMYTNGLRPLTLNIIDPTIRTYGYKDLLMMRKTSDELFKVSPETIINRTKQGRFTRVGGESIPHDYDWFDKNKHRLFP